MDEIHECFARREYARAIPLLQGYLSDHPAEWNPWYLLGQAYRFTGDLTQADAALAKSLALNGREPGVLLAVGIVQQLGSHYEAALATFAQANAVDPDFHLTYNSAGFTHEKMNQWEQAQAHYELALQALFREISRQADGPEAPEVTDREPFGELWVDYTLQANRRFLKTVIQDGKKMLQVDTTFFGYLPRIFAILVGSSHYPTYLRNRAKALRNLGRADEATTHEAEADLFA